MSGESDQRIPGRASFRRQLAEAAQQPEFMRAESMIGFLCQIRHRPYFTQDECFTAVYGAGGARAFWEVICSEPIELRLFVKLLAVTGAPLKAAASNLLDVLVAAVTGATLEEAVYTVNVCDALLAAYQAGERTWFVGDGTPLEGSAYGWQVIQAPGLDKLKVRARDAAEWLWRTPRRRHLVPDWLAAVLRPLVQPHPIREPEADRNPLTARPRGTDRALTTWFEERVAAWPDGQMAPSEENDWAEAKDHFAPGLTREKFRNGRDIATPEAWRKRGRRRPWGEAKLLNPP
jgi:hypothetical protein